jgi:hypothetical protein
VGPDLLLDGFATASAAGLSRDQTVTALRVANHPEGITET